MTSSAYDKGADTVVNDANNDLHDNTTEPEGNGISRHRLPVSYTHLTLPTIYSV